MKWLDLPRELGNTPPLPGESNKGFSKEGQKRQKLADVQKAQNKKVSSKSKLGSRKADKEKWNPEMDE